MQWKRKTKVDRVIEDNGDAIPERVVSEGLSEEETHEQSPEGSED